jgi:hypothetical protein
MAEKTRAGQGEAAAPLVRVLLTNGHVASDGTQGPWRVAEVPVAEANIIVSRRYGRILQPDEQPDELGHTARIARGVTN